LLRIKVLNAEQEIKRIIGPYGEQLTLEQLPPPSTKRWVIRRKAIVVAAVRGGLISLTDACERYQLSEEEFKSWQLALEKHGLPGLRTTRLQQYRDPEDVGG
jgi:Protein of unknown function (DUF1153)